MNALRLLETSNIAHLTTAAPLTAMQPAASLITRLMSDPTFPNLQHLTLPTQTPDNGPTIAHSFDVGVFLVQLYVWPAHSETQIHDHSAWGAFGALRGALHEERYRRLDDGTALNVAQLELRWERDWRREDGVSTLLPRNGGIHRVSNPSNEPAISVHIYGPAEEIDGRDYDPSRNYVCDRYK